MNFLLRQLQRAGVMTRACIACGDESLAVKIASRIDARAVMDMGEATRPGRYWVVHTADVEALQGKGYRLVKTIDQGEVT